MSFDNFSWIAQCKKPRALNCLNQKVRGVQDQRAGGKFLDDKKVWPSKSYRSDIVLNILATCLSNPISSTFCSLPCG